mgnify:CR=1 FL=1
MEEIIDQIERLNVLVIEDNPGDFVLIKNHLLEKFNQPEITNCSSFASVEDYLKNSNEELSIILLDLHLSDLKGVDLIEKALAVSYDVPIVVLTGYSDLNLAEKSLQMGIYDYLIKDEITPASLHKTIIFSLNRNSYIKQIAEEKSNYVDLFNFNPQPTWLLDATTFSILHANLAAQKKYGFELNDFQKMIFTQLHPTEEEGQIKDKLKNNGDKGITHFTHYLSNGEEIKIDINLGEIITASEKQLIVQSNDISENLKHINTIELQNSKLRNIAWAQSHELKAIFTRMSGIIEMIEEHPDNYEKILFWIKKLKTSIVEIENINNKVL